MLPCRKVTSSSESAICRRNLLFAKVTNNEWQETADTVRTPQPLRNDGNVARSTLRLAALIAKREHLYHRVGGGRLGECTAVIRMLAALPRGKRRYGYALGST